MDPNEYPVRQPLDPRQLGLLSVALPSPVGDVVGLLSDAAGYYKDPKSLTVGSGLLSLAGLIPGVPSGIGKMRVRPEGYKHAVDLMVNPSTDDLARVFSAGGLDRKMPFRYSRGADGTVYVWASEDATHAGVSRALEKLGVEFDKSVLAEKPMSGWFSYGGDGKFFELNHAGYPVK